MMPKATASKMYLPQIVSCRGALLNSAPGRRAMSACRFLADGSIRIEGDDVKDSSDPSSSSPAPGHGRVSVKLRAAPCTPADIRTLAAASATVEKTQLSTLSPPPPPPHLKFAFPFVGGTECLWEVTRTGEGVSSFQAGDLAIPTVPRDPPGTAPETGTWRTTATLDSASLIRVPWGGGGAGSRGNGNVIGLDPDISGDVISPAVAAHVSASVATAIRILEDFSPKPLEKGDRVVFTGASSAVAQILLQLAAARGLESVCLVNTEEEAALAVNLGAWKAMLLKEFKAMRMDNAFMVADGEGGVLGFTAARALRFRGFFVSYGDASGGGVSLPVAGQIFSDTRCLGFSLPRWAAQRSLEETRALVSRSLEVAAAVGLRLDGAREFRMSDAAAAIEAVRSAPGGAPVLIQG